MIEKNKQKKSRGSERRRLKEKVEQKILETVNKTSSGRKRREIENLKLKYLESFKKRLWEKKKKS